MVHKKRGQTSLFIIIGVVILIGIGFFLSTSQEVSLDAPEATREYVTDTIPTGSAPVYEFVKSCVEQLTKEGIKKLGQHGGYIDPNNKGYVDGGSSALQVNPTKPHESEALLFAPESDLKIAYWNYIEGDCVHKSSCGYNSQMPALFKEDDPQFSVEAQLGNYVEQHIDSCVSGFDEFKDAGWEVTKGEKSARVDVNYDDVTVILTYPLDFKKGPSAFNIQQFTAKQFVDLITPFSYAGEIAAFDRNQMFFAENTMSWIHLYSGLDPTRLPPTSAQSSGAGSRVFWLKSHVADSLQDILQTYIPFMRVSNARNNQVVVPPTAFSPVQYNRMVMPVHIDMLESTPDTLQDESLIYVPLEVNFKYLSLWPMHLDITGSGANGEYIGPHSGRPAMSFFSLFEMNDYEFYYDVAYPVLAEIYDDDAFQGEGFKLNFALEVNVIQNHHAYSTLSGAESDGLNPVSHGTMLCNFNQRASDPITIRTFDALTGEPLPKVLMNYGCGDVCDLQYTEFEELPDDAPPGKEPNAVLTTSLPSCLGGQLFGSHTEYANVGVDLDVTEDTEFEETIDLHLYPLHDLKVDVRKYMNRPVGLETDGPDKHIWDLDKTPRKLYDNEVAVVILSREDGGALLGEDWPNIIQFNTSLDEPAVVRVTPGTYKVSVMVVEQRPSTIIQPQWWCKSDIHENNCNMFNYTVPSQMGGGYGVLNAVTLGLHNVPCATALDVDSVEAIEDWDLVETTCKACSTLDTCSLVDAIEINKTMFKGEVSWDWEVTEDIYNYNAVTFRTLTSPDGYRVEADGTTDLKIEDMQMLGNTGDLKELYGYLLKAIPSVDVGFGQQ